MTGIAVALGAPPMEWQAQVIDVATELVKGHRPAYRECFITVPRQQGKTLVMVAMMLHRCLAWPRTPQRCAYTAQDGSAGVQKWMDEIVPMIKRSPLNRFVESVVRTNGREGVRFTNGSIIRILPTAESTGHGGTWDLVVLDEIWKDVDTRREAAFRPGMSRVADAQVLICSTAGTAESTIFNRKITLGREMVKDDPGDTMAFFEWSAPDEFDPGDEARWAEWMPAIAEEVIDPSVIRAERVALPEGEFKRAYCNKPTAGADMVIPEALWRQLVEVGAAAEGPLVLGLDVAEDRASAAVVAYGGGVFELGENLPGTSWVTKYCNDALAMGMARTIVIDGTGPASGFADEIDKVTVLKAREVQEACGQLFDAMIDVKVTFRQDDAFDSAVRGAVQKIHGDTWSWSRRGSSEDITPLVAATLAQAVKPPTTIDQTVW